MRRLVLFLERSTNVTLSQPIPNVRLASIFALERTVSKWVFSSAAFRASSPWAPEELSKGIVQHVYVGKLKSLFPILFGMSVGSLSWLIKTFVMIAHGIPQLLNRD
jgi:hypothetical protein